MKSWSRLPLKTSATEVEKQPHSGPFGLRGTPKMGRGRMSSSRVMNSDVVLTFYSFAMSCELYAQRANDSNFYLQRLGRYKKGFSPCHNGGLESFPCSG